MALRLRGCPPTRCLSEQLFNCGATFGKGSGMCPGSGPARDAGAWQLRPFQLCAQSRNSPGIRGRGKRLGWKNPTAPTHPALGLSHRCPRRGAAPWGRMGGAGGVGGSLHPPEPCFGGSGPQRCSGSQGRQQTQGHWDAQTALCFWAECFNEKIPHAPKPIEQLRGGKKTAWKKGEPSKEALERVGNGCLVSVESPAPSAGAGEGSWMWCWARSHPAATGCPRQERRAGTVPAHVQLPPLEPVRLCQRGQGGWLA